jgi:hypothetical protein
MSKDEPIKWAVPLTTGYGVIMGPWNGTFNGECWTSNKPAEREDTLTLRKLYDMVGKLPDPHPLSGLDQVVYAANMADTAHAFVAEYNKQPLLGRVVIASRSELLPPGYILGPRGKDTVLIAGPPKEPEAEATKTVK